MHSLNWNDLRYVIAVAKEGSAAAAARAIGVNHATVVRHVRAFEKLHAMRIFDHLSSGYRLTDEGQIFLDAARSIDATIIDLERKMVGGQDHLDGTVKITTTDGLYPMLVDVLADFQQLYPGVNIELIISNYQLNIKTMAADIAVRPSVDPPSDLVAQFVSGLAFAVYGADSLKSQGRFKALQEVDWIGHSDPLLESAPGQWMKDTIPDTLIKIRCNSFLTIQGLAESGVGYAILPCYLADKSLRIVRVQADTLNLSIKIWLVSHSDVLRAKRVRTCIDFLETRLKEKRKFLEVQTLDKD